MRLYNVLYPDVLASDEQDAVLRVLNTDCPVYVTEVDNNCAVTGCRRVVCNEMTFCSVHLEEAINRYKESSPQ